MTGGYTMKEKNIRELAKRMGLITVENMCQYTIAQLVVMVANKVNELIGEVGQFELDVVETVKTQNEKIQYLLGEGLHLEVENIFDGWFEDGTFDTLINQSALKKVNDRIDETNAQMSRLESQVNFTELLIDNKINSIKLIGDSVTWGADADGWETIGHSGRLICDGKYEMSHDLDCWANLFRRYVKKKNPSVDFFNAGISGYAMKQCSVLKNQWIGSNTDCAFLILGINDGSQSESKHLFEQYTREVISYMKDNVKYPFVCSTSILGDNNVSPVNNTTLNDRNQIIKKIANELNVTFLDLNQEILKVCCDFGVTLKKGMFYVDELTHPSSLGHKMIWIALQRLLKIVDDPQTMVDGGYKNESYLVNELPTGFNLNTKPSETNFYNKNSHAFICVGNADIDGFGLPVERAGTVEIINPLKGTEGFVIQKFTTLYNGQYQRVFVNGIWTEWSSDSAPQDIDVSLQNGWVNSSSFTPSYLKIRGNQVELFLRVKDGSVNSSGNVVVCSLPTEATPQKTFLVPVYDMSNGVTIKNASCFISNDGNVYFNKFQTSGESLVHVCYLV